ncbi:MAG: hypothetical protein IKD78_12310, partial [Bacteroidales bacterium]|nr:hypothetical protein [Bacteroidales bacterium]
MKKSLLLWMTVAFMAVFGMANASAAQWYGYALYTSNGANWQDHFVSFDTQNPNAVQAVSETFPTIWAATYLDGYVWFVTNTRNLCKAPFNEETQTIGNYETIVPTLEQYNLYIDMSYNPVDGMMYYLCQDSQYNSYLKRSNLATPSEVEVVGMFSVKLWTLTINTQGQAYGVAYEGGNLYEIDLNNATTTLVGPTGKEVWYTQSMAFDLDTGELYWAQFATMSDHGLYQVNTETGTATLLGEIGQGTQLAGLFMVPQPTPPEPEIIDEIHVEDFTAPAWGEHPDYDIEVSPEAPYIITDVSWHRYVSYDDHVLEPDEYFDLVDVNYYMLVIFSPKEGFVFGENPMVYFDGDSSVFGYGILSDNDYRVYTI